MITVKCYRCAERFGLAEELYNVLKRSEQRFHCPHGHSQVFSLGPSEAEKLRQERDRLAQRIAEKDDEINWQRTNREAAERRASAMKGQVTKLKNRAAAGVCPCCNRTFQNLQRHMSTKHKGFIHEPVQGEHGEVIQ